MKHPRKKSNSVCTAYYNEVTINNARQTTPLIMQMASCSRESIRSALRRKVLDNDLVSLSSGILK